MARLHPRSGAVLRRPRKPSRRHRRPTAAPPPLTVAPLSREGRQGRLDAAAGRRSPPAQIRRRRFAPTGPRGKAAGAPWRTSGAYRAPRHPARPSSRTRPGGRGGRLSGLEAAGASAGAGGHVVAAPRMAYPGVQSAVADLRRHISRLRRRPCPLPWTVRPPAPLRHRGEPPQRRATPPGADGAIHRRPAHDAARRAGRLAFSEGMERTPRGLPPPGSRHAGPALPCRLRRRPCRPPPRHGPKSRAENHGPRLRARRSRAATSRTRPSRTRTRGPELAHLGHGPRSPAGTGRQGSAPPPGRRPIPPRQPRPQVGIRSGSARNGRRRTGRNR